MNENYVAEIITSSPTIYDLNFTLLHYMELLVSLSLVSEDALHDELA